MVGTQQVRAKNYNYRQLIISKLKVGSIKKHEELVRHHSHHHDRRRRGPTCTEQ
jgi:hypothetical protein